MILRRFRTIAPSPGSSPLAESNLNDATGPSIPQRNRTLSVRPVKFKKNIPNKGLHKKRVRNGARGSWTVDALEDAMEAVTRCILSQRAAAKHYGIPLTTLRNHLNGLSQNKFGSIPKGLTIEEEEHLVEWCLGQCDIGRPITLAILREHVREMTINRVTCFSDGLPGYKWWSLFNKRHPEISLRSAQCVEVARVRAMSTSNLINFYSTLRSIYDTIDLEPSRVWNCDETGIQAGDRTGMRVIARKGMRNVCETVPNSREWVSCLCCVNARGFKLPTLYVFKGKRMRDLFIKGCEPGAIQAFQNKAWITDALFVAWLEHFKENVPGGIDVNRPHLLICDGHGSHVTLEVIAKAKSMGLHILQLPAHTSHKLQPLDVGCFSPFKHSFRKLRASYMLNHACLQPSREDLATLIWNALDKGMTAENIMAGFSKTGIWPFNSEAVVADPIANQMEEQRQTEAVERASRRASQQGTNAGPSEQVNASVGPPQQGTNAGPSEQVNASVGQSEQVNASLPTLVAAAATHDEEGLNFVIELHNSQNVQQVNQQTIVAEAQQVEHVIDQHESESIEDLEVLAARAIASRSQQANNGKKKKRARIPPSLSNKLYVTSDDVFRARLEFQEHVDMAERVRKEKQDEKKAAAVQRKEKKELEKKRKEEAKLEREARKKDKGKGKRRVRACKDTSSSEDEVVILRNIRKRSKARRAMQSGEPLTVNEDDEQYESPAESWADVEDDQVAKASSDQESSQPVNPRTKPLGALYKRLDEDEEWDRIDKEELQGPFM